MRGARERGEVLDAAHAPAALHLSRRGAEGRLACRGGAVGLRERLGEDGAVLDDALVDPGAAALVQRAVLGRHGQVVRDLARPQHAAGVHVEGERGGAAPAAQLGGHERVGRVVGAEAAVALRDGEGEEAGLAEVGIVLEGERRLAIVAMARARRSGRGPACGPARRGTAAPRSGAGACPEEDEAPIAGPGRLEGRAAAAGEGSGFGNGYERSEGGQRAHARSPWSTPSATTATPSRLTVQRRSGRSKWPSVRRPATSLAPVE